MSRSKVSTASVAGERRRARAGGQAVAWLAAFITIVASTAAAQPDGEEGVVEIHAKFSGWSVEARRALAEGFRKKHPDTIVQLPEAGPGVIAFAKGEVDLWLNMIPAGAFSSEGPELQKPEPIVLGYVAMAAFVHPSHDLESISMPALRRIVGSRTPTLWSEVGSRRRDFVRIWSSPGNLDILYSLKYDHQTGEEIRVQPEQQDPARIAEAERLRREVERLGFRERVLARLLEDRSGLAILRYDRDRAQSGLQPLAVRPAAGADAVPLTPRTVGEGRYEARLVCCAYVHPDASAAAKDFVEWLQGDEAGRILARHYIFRADNIKHAPSIIATARPRRSYERRAFEGAIDGAVAVLPTRLISRYFLMTSDSHQAAYEHAILEGIAADGRLDMVDRASIEAALRERELSLSGLVKRAEDPKPIVAADVIVLPRIVTNSAQTELWLTALHPPTASTLDELRLGIDPADPLTFDKPLEQIVAAWWPGVLRSLEQIRTQSRWIVAPIMPADIDQAGEVIVAERRLRGILRSADEVALVDGPVLTATQRELVMNLMGLSRDRQGGFAPSFDYLVDGEMIDERTLLLTVRNRGYEPIARQRFTDNEGAARLDAATRWLKARVTEASKPDGTAESAIGDSWAKLQARVKYRRALDLERWITIWDLLHIEHHAVRPEKTPSFRLMQDQHAASVIAASFERFRRDAMRLAPDAAARILEGVSINAPAQSMRYESTRLLFVDGEQLSPAVRRDLAGQWARYARRLAELYTPLHRSIAERAKTTSDRFSGSTTSFQPLEPQLDALRRTFWDEVHRASQFDPTWPDPMDRIVSSWSRVTRNDVSPWVDQPPTTQFDAMRYFIDTFPDADRYPSLLLNYGQLAVRFAKRVDRNLPSTVDRKRVQRRYFEEGIDAYLRFCGEFVVRNERELPHLKGEFRFQHYDHLLYYIFEYARIVQPDARTRRQLIERWAEAFDGSPELAPPSGFVRLMLHAGLGEYEQFMALLRKLQRAQPDSSKMPWRGPNDAKRRSNQSSAVANALAKAMPYITGDHEEANRLREWLEGKRDLEALP